MTIIGSAQGTRTWRQTILVCGVSDGVSRFCRLELWIGSGDHTRSAERIKLIEVETKKLVSLTKYSVTVWQMEDVTA